MGARILVEPSQTEPHYPASGGANGIIVFGGLAAKSVITTSANTSPIYVHCGSPSKSSTSANPIIEKDGLAAVCVGGERVVQTNPAYYYVGGMGWDGIGGNTYT